MEFTRLWGTGILDDAERRVVAFSPRAAAREIKNDPELAELEIRVQAFHLQGPEGAHRRTLYFMAGSFLCMIVVVVVIVMTTPAGLASWLLGVLGVGFIVVMPFWIFAIHQRRRLADLSELMVSHGRCASCGYSLRGLPVGKGGFVTCAECSASWFHDRIRFTIVVPKKARVVDDGTSASDEATVIRHVRSRMFATVLRDRDGQLMRAADARLRGAEAWLGEEEATLVRKRIRSRLRLLRGIMLIGCVLILGLFVFNTGTRLTKTLPTTLTTWASVGSLVWNLAGFLPATFFYGLLVWAIWTYRFPMLARRGAGHLLVEGLCPACAKRLDPRPVRGGPATRCASCGGVWADELEATSAKRSEQETRRL